LLRLYTQNVDGIDTSLPPLATTVPLNTKGPWPTTIQLHGGLDKMVCQKCHHLSQFEASLFDGPTPPSCRECKERDGLRTMFEGKRSHGIGRLRPRIVLYNEYNPDEEAIGAVTRADLRSRPDAVIVVGTSLKIPGVRRIVREMCGVVRGRRDGVAIWINKDPAPLGKDFENCWDLVVQGSSDEVARRARMRRWDATESEGSVGQESLDFSSAPTELEDAESTPDSPSKNPTFDRVQGILTPARSPHSKSTKLDGSELTARLSKEALKSPSKHSKPKTKQSTLSGLAKPTTSDSKKKLSTKSKSRKKPTATNPSKTINSSFSVTKKAEGSSATKAPGTKHSSSQINRTVDESSSLQAETKSEASDSHQMESHSKMNLTINVAQDPARPCGTMLPISPSEARNNNGSPIIHHSPDWLVKSEEFTVSQEAMSPTTAQRGEIFSPKGPLPKNSGIILN
jgi:NAD-dependent histone deacetylase SIR2